MLYDENSMNSIVVDTRGSNTNISFLHKSLWVTTKYVFVEKLENINSLGKEKFYLELRLKSIHFIG